MNGGRRLYRDYKHLRELWEPATFSQLVLKAEGIRSNPNTPPPPASPPLCGPPPQCPMAGQVWAAQENRGENRKTGRRRWGTVCRTWLFRSVDPIRRVVTCLVRGHVPPERHAGGWTRRRGRVCLTVSSGHIQFASLEQLVI
ncbi:hypothetical protein Q8A73_012864 [Channa argus]|nr:hypothetical protein Q8A73_012864 [Channa argus]